MSGDVKIQINSLEALERLLGDSETMELEMRHAVAESLARGFIKSVANVDLIKKHIDALRNEMQQSVSDLVLDELGAERKTSWNNKGITLGTELEVQIRSEAREAVRGLVREAVSAVDVKSVVEDYLSHRIQSEARKAVESGIQDRIKAAIKEAMQFFED